MTSICSGWVTSMSGPLKRLTQPRTRTRRVAVALDAPPAEGERHHAIERERLERALGLAGQRPGREIGPAERQLRRLDADHADLFAGVEHDGVAVDHLDDARRAAGGQLGHGHGRCGEPNDEQGEDMAAHDDHSITRPRMRALPLVAASL